MQKETIMVIEKLGDQLKKIALKSELRMLQNIRRSDEDERRKNKLHIEEERKCFQQQLDDAALKLIKELPDRLIEKARYGETEYKFRLPLVDVGTVNLNPLKIVSIPLLNFCKERNLQVWLSLEGIGPYPSDGIECPADQHRIDFAHSHYEIVAHISC